MSAKKSLVFLIAGGLACLSSAALAQTAIKEGKGAFPGIPPLPVAAPSVPPASKPVSVKEPVVEAFAPSQPVPAVDVVQPVAVAPVPASAPSPVASAVPPPVFRLKGNEPLHEQLQGWATANGWQLIWYPRKSWIVLGDSNFSDSHDVVDAVERVVNIVRAEGKPIFLSVAHGNSIMEISSNEVGVGTGDYDEN